MDILLFLMGIMLLSVLAAFITISTIIIVFYACYLFYSIFDNIIRRIKR